MEEDSPPYDDVMIHRSLTRAETKALLKDSEAMDYLDTDVSETNDENRYMPHRTPLMESALPGPKFYYEGKGTTPGSHNNQSTKDGRINENATRAVAEYRTPVLANTLSGPFSNNRRRLDDSPKNWSHRNFNNKWRTFDDGIR